MAKRKAARRTKSAKTTRKGSAQRRSAKRPTARRSVKRQATARTKTSTRNARKKAAPARKSAKRQATSSRKAAPPRKAAGSAKAPAKTAKVPRLDRARRILDEPGTLRTPPSSLDMNDHGSSARSGRAGMAQSQRDHHGMSPDITAGDADVDVEDAYFTGDEAPGGDNPSPDLEVVDDIGKALGVVYDDSEELKGSDKVVERDKHRWELDPASAEDYKERK